jgi:hypothetical protein
MIIMGIKSFTYCIEEETEKKFREVLGSDGRKKSNLIQKFVQRFLEDPESVKTWLYPPTKKKK